MFACERLRRFGPSGWDKVCLDRRGGRKCFGEHKPEGRRANLIAGAVSAERNSGGAAHLNFGADAGVQRFQLSPQQLCYAPAGPSR